LISELNLFSINLLLEFFFETGCQYVAETGLELYPVLASQVLVLQA
jgi:hypothetical protein